MNKDITLFQEQSNGEFLEKKVTPTAHQVIGFDASKNPISKLAQPFVYTAKTSPNVWATQTASGSRNWQAIASSADGMKLIASSASGYLYTSTDGGATWIERTAQGIKNWRGLASSNDGAKLAIGVYNGYVYTSTDSGATWIEQTASGVRNWSKIASSADGMRLAAIVYNGYIYISTDGGANWQGQDPMSLGVRYWTDIASSSDGMILSACVDGSYIYRSTDGGTTWGELTAGGSRQWACLTTSSDGTKLGGGVSGGYIYTSVNSGTSWTERTVVPATSWHDIAMSFNGRMIAACAGGNFYVSTNDGVSWRKQLSANSESIEVALSADGMKLVSLVGTGYISTCNATECANLDEDDFGVGVIIPQNETWLYEVILLGVDDDYSVCRWSFQFAVQNTGPLIGIAGPIEGKAASFDAGEVITPDYSEFTGTVLVDVSQPNMLVINVASGGSVDWSASGSVVKIWKTPIGGGSSGSS